MSGYDAEVVREAVDLITMESGVPRHDLAVVMGSGWRDAADVLGRPTYEKAMERLPGFAPPTVPGHGGAVRSLVVGGLRVLVFLGRTHLYEGRGMSAVTHPVRVAAEAGCHTVLLTNGCGSLNPDWRPGTAVLIADHLNLTSQSPLSGPSFVDLTDLYSRRLRSACRSSVGTIDEGVYAQLPGPHYETPAEIAMLRTLGADLVGMSTVVEAIAARAVGLEVLGLSLVTNLAAGMTGGGLDHSEVVDAGRQAADHLGDLVVRTVSAIGTSR